MDSDQLGGKTGGLDLSDEHPRDTRNSSSADQYVARFSYPPPDRSDRIPPARSMGDCGRSRDAGEFAQPASGPGGIAKIQHPHGAVGLQGRSQIEMRYGREAEAMLSQPRTKIFLRTSEPRAADWISKCIGDVEIEHLREGRTSGEFGFHQSKNASVDNRIQTAILASEVSNLENLNGFFQTPGFTLKLKFPYLKPAKTEPPFVRGADPGMPVPAHPPEPSEPQQLTLGGTAAEAEPGSGHRGKKRKPKRDDTSESRPMLQVN